MALPFPTSLATTLKQPINLTQGRSKASDTSCHFMMCRFVIQRNRIRDFVQCRYRHSGQEITDA